MKVNKNIIISVVVTLVLGVGISAIVFKPMGTVATEKNNAELYLQMKEEAKAEVQAELEEQFNMQLADEVKKIKEDTDTQIEKLKIEYDKAIADAKLEQANNIQVAIEQANVNAQKAIDNATSPQAIEQRRQEEMKKNPIEVPDVKAETPPEPPKYEPEIFTP
ncbi:hypothetical protein [Clostridium sp.]|uniref:hypothetical protein n=1 Tax=Clostridium sp. TaxID=1506 RepID=UPI001DF5EE47|nr:hypothetical protein [Clostridium sp.]MBS5937104.1 hypothetical protein [Clostridium sp.]